MNGNKQSNESRPTSQKTSQVAQQATVTPATPPVQAGGKEHNVETPKNGGTTPPTNPQQTEKKAEEIVKDLGTAQTQPAQATPTTPVAPTQATPTVVPAEGQPTPVVEGQGTPVQVVPEVVEPKIEYPDYLYTGPRPTVALLVTGGINSTLLLLTLLQRGYDVRPYFYSDGSKRERRSYRKAKLIVKKVREHYKDRVAKLETIEMAIPKSKWTQRRRLMIIDLTKHLKGEGVNAIGLGLVEVENPEDTEEQKEDATLAFLQEHTALQLVSFSTFDLNEYGQMLDEVSANPLRDVAFLATSCLESAKKRECGNCDNCKIRHKAFMRRWGADNTRYKKGSKVWELINNPSESPSESGEVEVDEEMVAIDFEEELKKLRRKFKKGKIDKKTYHARKAELIEMVKEAEAAAEHEEGEESESEDLDEIPSSDPSASEASDTAEESEESSESESSEEESEESEVESAEESDESDDDESEESDE